MACIVCPTDFSENAKKATNWAAFLSTKLNLPLHLYHCYHIPVMVNDIPFPLGSEVKVEEGANELLTQESERLKTIYKNLEVKTRVEPGFANESIREYATNNKAKLIVIGITGRGAAGQVLVGSTAVSTALNSKIPVLIIPSQSKSIKIINIAMACDFSQKENVKDIDLFFQLADTFDSTIELVHVSQEGEKIIPNPTEKISRIENYKYSVHKVENESVEPGLVHFTERNNIDILTIIHKNHGFFERIFKRSHTGKIAFKINIPLLVLHD